MAASKALEEVKTKAGAFYKVMEEKGSTEKLVAAHGDFLQSLEGLKSAMRQDGICSEKMLQVVKSDGDLEAVIRFKERNRVAVNSNAEAVVRAFERAFNQ